MRLSWMLHATHENAASIYLFVLGVILPARYPAIANQTEGIRLGPPSSLGEKSRATKASNEWSAYFAGCLVVPDDGKGAHSKMPGRRVAILRAIRSFWRVSSNKVKGQPEPTRWPARAKVRGRRQHDSFGASSLFRCSVSSLVCWKFWRSRYFS